MSNFSLDRLRSLNMAGQARFTALQNEYNLVMRGKFGPDYMAYCAEAGVAHYPWYGLAAGLLTGKYRSRYDLAKFSRGRSIERFFDAGIGMLPALDAIASETGASLGAVALAWLKVQPGINAPTASASRPEQLDLHVEALALSLSPEHLARLTALVP